MGKIVLNETQYNRLKNILIENAIDRSLLNEQTDDFSYTIPQEYVRFTNANDITANYLKIFKGAKFIPDSKGNLVAKTKIQFTTVIDGIVQSSYNDSDDADDAREQKLYTYDTNLKYNCKEGKMITDKAPGQKYYADTNDSKNVVEKLNGLCRKSKSQKSSYGAESVGGGKSYSQKKNYVLKSDKGTSLKIPEGTGYSFKEGKNGASFRLPGNKFGWFGCLSKTFQVDGVKYKDEKGALANNISKAICGSTKPPKEETITKREVVYKGGGGSENYDTSEFDLYI